MRIHSAGATLTINLAPADVKKEGSAFDLPMAIGMLGAAGRVRAPTLTDTLTAASGNVLTSWNGHIRRRDNKLAAAGHLDVADSPCGRLREIRSPFAVLGSEANLEETIGSDEVAVDRVSRKAPAIGGPDQRIRHGVESHDLVLDVTHVDSGERRGWIAEHREDEGCDHYRWQRCKYARCRVRSESDR